MHGPVTCSLLWQQANSASLIEQEDTYLPIYRVAISSWTFELDFRVGLLSSTITNIDIDIDYIINCISCFKITNNCVILFLLLFMCESNPRVPIPPGQPPGIWHELSPGWKGIWHLFKSQYPGHLTPWKKRRNILCIPIVCININRESSVKDCFQFYFVTTWVQWSIKSKNKY